MVADSGRGWEPRVAKRDDSDPKNRQPVVILGGFLSTAGAYRRMASVLANTTGQQVTVVPVRSLDWLPLVSALGWSHLLRKTERAVIAVARSSPTGKVTLIGHSAGGVLARLFLSPETFQGRAYAGVEVVSHLITLGSPHYNMGGLTRGGRLSRWVEQHYPGAFFAPDVQYTSVAGKWARCATYHTRSGRRLCKIYREIGGEEAEWGDGLIPVVSALLRGSQHIVLDGVCHYSLFSSPWYGSEDVIPRWWSGSGWD